MRACVCVCVNDTSQTTHECASAYKTLGELQSIVASIERDVNL